MSAKNLDKHDRFRCITVGFRVSPEEHETINRIVALSGLTKQEYCYRKCTDREIIVEGNPRVYKALKVELAAVLDELKRIESGGNVSGDLLEVIDQINKTLYGLKEDLDDQYNGKDCPECICWRRYGAAFSKMYCKYYNRRTLQFQ